MSMRRAEVVTRAIIGTDTRAVMRNVRISPYHDEVMKSVPLIHCCTTYCESDQTNRYTVSTADRRVRTENV